MPGYIAPQGVYHMNFIFTGRTLSALGGNLCYEGCK